MKNAQKRSPFRWVFLGLAGAILLVFSGSLVFGEEGLIRYFELRRELTETNDHILLVRQQNSELKARLDSLKEQSPMTLEEEARRHCLVGQNEELYEVEVR